MSFRKRASELGVRVSTDVRLVNAARRGSDILAVLRHELTSAEIEVCAGQLVVEHGTMPMDEVYNELRTQSSNNGVTDIALMTGAHTQEAETARGEGSFELHRIGDAVASRDIYSAVYEAYRLCSCL